MFIGHQKQREFLKRSIERGRVPHAMLFSGQEELGKKTLAFEFIKLLNCQTFLTKKNNGRACQVCGSCREIEKRIFPDLILVEPEEKEIKVARIRELHSRLSLCSLSGNFKAVIIDKADCLNQEAQSSFLKLLEEPRGRTIFILISQYPERLFPTILSRVEVLKFYPVPELEIKEELKNKGLSENKAREVAAFSLGKPGRAINFLLDPKGLDSEKQRIKEVAELINSDLAFRFQYAKKISGQPPEIKKSLETWLRYFRKILMRRIRNQESGIRNQESGIRKEDAYLLSQLRKILSLIQNTQFLTSTTNVNPKLALEILMLEI